MIYIYVYIYIYIYIYACTYVYDIHIYERPAVWQGPGVLSTKDGRVLEGVWDEGVCVQVLSEGGNMCVPPPFLPSSCPPALAHSRSMFYRLTSTAPHPPRERVQVRVRERAKGLESKRERGMRGCASKSSAKAATCAFPERELELVSPRERVGGRERERKKVCV